MILMTKEITEKAQAQWKDQGSMNQMVVAKFFDPAGSWSWYVMNQDPENPDYLWGIVKGIEVEVGSFSLSELESTRGRFGLGIERDKFFTPQSAMDVYAKLNKGEHV
jgi:hypothetical protein